MADFKVTRLDPDTDFSIAAKVRWNGVSRRVGVGRKRAR